MDDRKTTLGYPPKVAELDTYSWDADAWKKKIQGCKKVDLNISNPYLFRFVETIALDLGVPYNTSIERKTYYKDGVILAASPKDMSADCSLADHPFD